MNTMPINPLSFIQEQGFSSLAEQLSPILVVALKALAFLAIAYAAISAVRFFLARKEPTLKLPGVDPHNPIGIIQPSGTIQAPKVGWDGLPADIARLIMCYAELSSIGNMQQVSKRMQNIFQLEPFINSGLFKGSCLGRQNYLVDLDNQKIIFPKNRTAESLIRLGFKAVEENSQGHLSEENIQRGLQVGLQRISLIFNQLFEQNFRELSELESKLEGACFLSPNRQVARYYEDFQLWTIVAQSGLRQYHHIFINGNPSLKNNAWPILKRFESHSLKQVTRLRFGKIQFLPHREDWPRDRENRFNTSVDVESSMDDIDFDFDHKQPKPLPLDLLRAYLDIQGFHEFNGLDGWLSKKITFKPKSELVICGMVAANFLRHIEYMKSEKYWEAIDHYEQVLSEGDEDWSPLCKEVQNLAKLELAKEKPAEDQFDPRLQLRLLTRGVDNQPLME